MALAAQAKGEVSPGTADDRGIGEASWGPVWPPRPLITLGALKLNQLVVLNDKGMSISPPVGAISGHLGRLLSGRRVL